MKAQTGDELVVKDGFPIERVAATDVTSGG